MPAGPLRFDDFMRHALYHPETGYYRRPQDPFGKHGDFFTAAQLQPLFGSIVAAEAANLCPAQPVFELGPGRGELSTFFQQPYTGIRYGDKLPRCLNGFLFANEFLDALPVRLGLKHQSSYRELLVDGDRFVRGPLFSAAWSAYVDRYWPLTPEGGSFEIAAYLLTWIDRIARRMDSGYALFIDYGFTTPETARFPQGTLMSYRRHRATPNVLLHPGSQDITAHVPFDALVDRARLRGFELIRVETLQAWVLRHVERSPALAGSPEALKQLRTLLFGLGETFRCVLLRKNPLDTGPEKKKASISRGQLEPK